MSRLWGSGKDRLARARCSEDDEWEGARDPIDGKRDWKVYLRVGHSYFLMIVG